VSEISKEPINQYQSSINSSDVTQIELESRGGAIELTLLPLIKSGVRLGSVVLLHNVTEIRRRERELLLKDATIKEIHHRVKNNLQTVSALLRLQSRRVEDLKARGALDEAVRRISSIALVHETLSASGKDEVDFDSVVDSLITHAVDLAPRASQHVTDISVKRLGALGSVNPKVATPLSLIITELVANAIEHGLTTKGSRVDVVFSRTGNSCVVKIEDDGVGLPEGFNLKDSSNLGLQIVRTLTESELSGTLEISANEKGTTAQLRFEIR
jgi:two-component sensor histidine kinase